MTPSEAIKKSQENTIKFKNRFDAIITKIKEQKS
jgi:hypothetical protein